MPDYRIYGVNEAGRFISVHEVHSENDDQAILAGRQLVGCDAFEVWERTRFVAHPARLKPQVERQGADEEGAGSRDGSYRPWGRRCR